MEQIKKLPIVEQVPFTAYQTRGFEAGILLGNFKNAEELLFQTCINFFFRIILNYGTISILTNERIVFLSIFIPLSYKVGSCRII